MKKTIVTLAVALMAVVSVNAQDFSGIGIKTVMTFGEQAVTPMLQGSYEIRTPGIFALEGCLAIGERYLSFSGINEVGEVNFQGLNFVADLDIYAKIKPSKIEYLLGAGYAHRSKTGYEDCLRTAGNFNPEMYSISGFKASAGVGISLYENLDAGDRLSLKVLANLVSCMVSGQKTMKPGMEIALTYYL